MSGNEQRRDIDPRGIYRKQARVLVDPAGGSTLVQYECGHVGEMAQHFTYKVGDIRFCFRCGEEALAADTHAQILADNARLREKLAECAKRLERCIVHSGSDKESAALAVAEYLALAKPVTP